MRKFVAVLVAIALAAVVTLLGVTAAQATGTLMTCTPTTNAQPSGVVNPPQFDDPQHNIIPGYAYFTQGQSGQYMFPSTGWVGSPTYRLSAALPAGLSLNTTTGTISGTPTVAMSQTPYTLYAEGLYSNTSQDKYCIGYEFSISVYGNGGNNNSQWTNVSLTYASANHSLASSIDGLNNGENFPGYTTTFTGIGGGTYDSFNIVVGDLNAGNFYTVPGATSNNWSTGATSWTPNGTNCGITNIIRGGAALTASSNVSCMKMTTVSNGQTQYWVRVELGSASADDISFTVAPGTFVIANKSSGDQFASFLLRNDANTNTNYSARKFQLLNASNIGGVGSSGSSSSIADFTLPTGIGQPIAGQTVGINATNLALNTNYSVVLRSTPQILEQGTTTATFMNTTVTIPAGLEPGWHSITFSAVRSDGVSTEQVAYFKISASGILLQTSTEVPAELAFTAAPKGDQWGIGFLIAMLGIGLITAAYTYRRRVFEMVYVLTGNGSNLDIELVEQPKKARYLPMRKLK